MTLLRIAAPFYHSDFPSYMNYGRLGTTFAHELAHGVLGVRGHFNGPLSQLNRTLVNRKCIEEEHSAVG